MRREEPETRSRSGPPPLRPGIISVIQTPFDSQGAVDQDSLENLVEDAIAGGVNGFLVPAVASEVAGLTAEERAGIVRLVTGIADRACPHHRGRLRLPAPRLHRAGPIGP